MYTILMESDGSLVCTTPSDILYQGESLVDNFHLLLPQKYKDVELKDYTVTLKYVSPINISKIEILTLNNSEYKTNFLEYVLPITTELTKFVGEITLYITMTKFDAETHKKYVAHSGETTINIDKVNDYFTDENSLQSIDKEILKLQEIASQYDKVKADNIVREGNKVQLTSNGTKIGDSVSIEACDPEGIDVVEFTTSEPENPEDFDVVEF